MAEYKKIFEFSSVEYPDSVLGITLTMSGKCRISFSCGEDADTIRNAEDFLKRYIPTVIGGFADDEIGYEKLPYLNNETSELLASLAAQNSNLNSSFAIKELSITELFPADSDYPDIIEAKRRLSGYTPPPEQQAPAVSAAPLEDGLYDVVLMPCSQKDKMNVIAAVRKLLGTGLADAKNMVESAPQVIMSGVPAAAASSMKARFDGTGAVIELRKAGSGASASAPTNKRICPSCGADLSGRPADILCCPKCGKTLK